jgi:hypothetical protein
MHDVTARRSPAIRASTSAAHRWLAARVAVVRNVQVDPLQVLRRLLAQASADTVCANLESGDQP